MALLAMAFLLWRIMVVKYILSSVLIVLLRMVLGFFRWESSCRLGVDLPILNDVRQSKSFVYEWMWSV